MHPWLTPDLIEKQSPVPPSILTQLAVLEYCAWIIDMSFGRRLSLASTVHLYQLIQMQPLGQRTPHRVVVGIFFLFWPECRGSEYGPKVNLQGFNPLCSWCRLACVRRPFRDGQVGYVSKVRAIHFGPLDFVAR